MEYSICKDNVLCCDDNCQRCANLIYNKYVGQKAEIERLKNAYKQCAWERDIFAEDCKEEIKKDISILQVDINVIKSNAITEFAERLKEQLKSCRAYDGGLKRMIDNLVKEMVGD